MTLRAMHSAATGMRVNEFSLDTIANNLANAGTTAFKRTRVNFEDLFYEYLKLPGNQDAAGETTPVGIGVGMGARVSGTEVDHTQGNPLETGKPLDVAIAGDGFFRVQDPNTGEPLFTRAGTFTLNANGQVVLASADRGRLLEPAISIPTEATNISITGDGVVSAIVPPSTTTQELGRIQISSFVNPQGLVQVGENLFSETAASGTPIEITPGQNGTGVLRQGFLESSNVEPVKELIGLIKTQRNFELNSQVVQASDQMLQLIANLRRI